ncbi:hypothetical protein [Kitasatospora sp. NPDC059327]|uniref:hypothetical protein n=1 Tax=Kitasatospora sp. NPDC059327 TaxID=3346803 RepID=UPI0036D14B04
MSARHHAPNQPAAPLYGPARAGATVWISPSPRKAAQYPLSLVRLARLSRAGSA